MLDDQYRLAIGINLLKRTTLELGKDVNIYYEPEERKLILKQSTDENKYFVATQRLSKEVRVVIPFSIRDAFPEATYLPVEKNGEISILIIEHGKKSE